jgi:pyruvate formate lyase activating enzyme
MRSATLLKTGKVPYEFRTTMVPDLVTSEDVAEIGKIVEGAEVLALQQFVAEDTMDKTFHALRPYAPEVINGFAQDMRKYVKTVLLRI